MSQPELLKGTVAVLAAAGIPYMLTGSVVSSLQGEPRATHDIDIVVDIRGPAAEAARALKVRFPEPDFYLDEAAAAIAIADRAFSVIETREGGQVAFWLLTDDAFDRSRFARRHAEEFEGTRLTVSRPEDTILMKLKWAASGGSDRQFVDALRVYEVQHGRLDEAYLDEWAARLSVTPLLARLRAEAEPIE
jgi:hypothetical protein